MLIDGLKLCGLLVDVFYQLFGLSFSWHPFTVELGLGGSICKASDVMQKCISGKLSSKWLAFTVAYSLVWRYGSVLGKNSLPIHAAGHEWAGRAAIITPKGKQNRTKQISLMNLMTFMCNTLFKIKRVWFDSMRNIRKPNSDCGDRRSWG